VAKLEAAILKGVLEIAAAVAMFGCILIGFSGYNLSMM